MSTGWQFNISQIASKVENRIALALPVLRMERLAVVIPIFLASSLLLMSSRSRILSRLMIIAIA
tara:strand:+ start:1276 stop:1467 length:192 start_codon:yes stop_codon:yes gene_type:complete